MEEKAIITQTVATQQFVPQLADRLSKALANAGHLELDGNNKFHNYLYPTIAQVRGHANKALSAAGIGIIPEILQEGRNQRDTDKGKVTNVTFVKLAIHVFAPEGMFTVRWVGESEDMTDKGLAKAVSAGIKSFLLAMMLMPVGEEENDDGETDAKKAAAYKRTNPAKSAKATTDRGPEWTEPESSAKPDDPPTQVWTFDTASAVTTDKGLPLGQCSPDQLTLILEKSKDENRRGAAAFLLKWMEQHAELTGVTA